MPTLSPDDLSIKIFVDGADRDQMLAMSKEPWISGFTTNPTLMRKAGITDYECFAHEVLGYITDLPISFEVFSDDFDEMAEQAAKIASWGTNTYVKVPVTNTRGVSSAQLIRHLVQEGVKLNVTAHTTPRQVEVVGHSMHGCHTGIVSVFAGRIADSGRDPIPIMRDSLQILGVHPGIELLWASPREVLNLVQADEIGCDIITMTGDLLAKLKNLGKDLTQYSLDTVRMFHDDASEAGFKL
jgi:transaldolase